MQDFVETWSLPIATASSIQHEFHFVTFLSFGVYYLTTYFEVSDVGLYSGMKFTHDYLKSASPPFSETSTLPPSHVECMILNCILESFWLRIL